jgi:hypothetical protein
MKNDTTDGTNPISTAADGGAAPASELPGMTVAALRAALAKSPERPLTVLWPDGDPIEAHFHVTEVGRVQKDFVDCGGTVRRTVTCLLQTWVEDDVEHRLTAGKLLKAFDHARPVLVTEDMPVELEYEACNVIQFKVTAIVPESDRLVIQLAGKHTDCLAKEVCGSSAPTASAAAGCC